MKFKSHGKKMLAVLAASILSAAGMVIAARYGFFTMGCICFVVCYISLMAIFLDDAPYGGHSRITPYDPYIEYEPGDPEYEDARVIQEMEKEENAKKALARAAARRKLKDRHH